MKPGDVTRAELERVARLYRTNQHAYRALGIRDKAFHELCRMHKVETPAERKKRIRTRI